MTDHNDMPEEILVFKVGQELYFWRESFPVGSQFRTEPTKYTRSDLTPKIEDAEVREALDWADTMINDGRITNKESGYIRTLIRAASQPVQEVTVEELVKLCEERYFGLSKDTIYFTICALRDDGHLHVKPAQRGEG